MGEPKVKATDRDWIAGVMGEIAKGNATYLHRSTIEKLARIAEGAILTALADDAVTVEGYAEECVFHGSPWDVRGNGPAHAELRFYDLPMPGTVPALSTIRRNTARVAPGTGLTEADLPKAGV